jgi:hypothetical protein
MANLILGQLMIPLLLLVVASWQALKAHRPTRGGLLIGFAVGLKLVLWPVVLWLAVSRRWRAFGAAGLTFTGLQLAAIATLGLSETVHYYRDIGPSVARLYSADPWNISAWSLAPKLFEGVGSRVLEGMTAPPVLSAPHLATQVAWILPLTILTFGLLTTRASRGFDASFALMVCVSVLVSPVTWDHYLALLLVPLVIGVQRLRERPPALATSLGLVATCSVLLLPNRELINVVLMLSGHAYGDQQAAASPAAALLLQLPMFAVLALGIILMRLDSDRSDRDVA